MKNLAIFGSGSGSNAENIYNYFKGVCSINVALICTNNQSAFIVNRAKKLHIPLFYTSKKGLEEFSGLETVLKKHGIDYIILAGFLLKIPEKMVQSYRDKIINIHPSLLPKYGGVGMFGKNVHLAVLKNKEKTSGITIHFVNENYDEGRVIEQKEVCISECKTIECLDKKIKSLELAFFARSIEKVILDQCQL